MRIDTTFSDEFDNWYNTFGQSEKGRALLDIEGISRRCLDVGGMSHAYFTEKFSDVTIDSNANAGEDISPNNYGAEIVKGIQKVEGYYLLYRYAIRRFGEARANEMLSSIVKGDVYFHDSSGINIQEIYCTSVSTTPIMLEGRPYGPLHSLPPKRADSFMAQCIEYTMDLSQQFAGAVALGDLIVNYAWYAKKEGLDDKTIINDFQKFVHVTNNTFRVGSQSPFTNISVFDRPNLEKLFEYYRYPDGSEVDYDYVMRLQKMFSEWFSKGDPASGLPYRFPVVTMNICCDEDKNIMDTNFLDFVSRVNLKNGCFNIYINEGNKIASCCLSSTTKLIVRIDGEVKYITAIQMYDIWKRDHDTRSIEMMGINGFVSVTNGIKLNNSRDMLRITLDNGLYITVTEDHPSVKVVDDQIIEVPASEIKLQDRIPVSKTISYDAVGGSIDLGRFVGLFGAEGLYDKRRDTEISFCFHTNEKDLQKFVIDFAKHNFGAESHVNISKEWENSTKVTIKSRSAHGLMRDMFNGDLATTKRLTSKVFGMSSEFRLGFMEGFIEGDGYTKDNTRSDYGSIHIGNPKLGKDLVALMNTINIKSTYRSSSRHGTTVMISSIDRHKLAVLSDWNRCNSTYSTQLRDHGDFYSVGVKSIERFNHGGNVVYDFEVDSDDHLFQVANGIITHNCRLVNDLDRMPFRADTFGNGGMNIGSTRVVTLNLPRIAIKAKGDREKLFKGLDDALVLARDLLITHREDIIERRINAEFLKFFSPLKWLDVRRYFSTFGIIGIYEMNKLMGMDIRTEEGEAFTLDVLKHIEEFAVKTSGETGHSFNVEEIPGESVASKLCQKDKVIFGDESVPFRLYSNQYIPVIENVPLPERIMTTGKFMEVLSGGGILHLNMQERVTDQNVMKKLILFAVNNGVGHLAVNYGFGTCEKGHTSICGNSTKCPICGGKIVDHVTRVIGYFSHVSNWGGVRREYEFPRRVFG